MTNPTSQIAVIDIATPKKNITSFSTSFDRNATQDAFPATSLGNGNFYIEHGRRDRRDGKPYIEDIKITSDNKGRNEVGHATSFYSTYVTGSKEYLKYRIADNENNITGEELVFSRNYIPPKKKGQNPPPNSEPFQFSHLEKTK